MSQKIRHKKRNKFDVVVDAVLYLLADIAGWLIQCLITVLSWLPDEDNKLYEVENEKEKEKENE